jgi:hypothetical protein
MSKLRSFKRHLNPSKVWLANQVAEEKIKIARQVVLERAKKDAEFAADVLKAVGENLPKEIKEACEESVKEHINQKLMKETEGLVAKWEKTGLLDGKLSDTASCNMAVLIESESKQIIEPIVGGDTTYKLTEVVQLDGGGEILVDPNEQVMDGPDSVDLTQKLVQEEGPKAEKA